MAEAALRVATVHECRASRRRRVPWCRSGWLCAFSAAAAVACYLNAPPCAFVFDDHLAITNNPDVQVGADFRALLHNDFWGKALVKEDSHKSYRPLTILSFRLHTWCTNKKPDPSAYHAANVVLHGAATAAVTELAARSWHGSLRRGSRGAALLAALLFGVHPVHVEAVTGVVGRAELLCALCCFAAAAAQALSVRASWPLTRYCGAIGMLVCFAGAVLSKETGITLVGILAAQERYRRACTLVTPYHTPPSHLTRKVRQDASRFISPRFTLASPFLS